jgi:hypothetical protein
MDSNKLETKIVMVSKEPGQALLGKHFHVLNDNSRQQFLTNRIRDFLDYLEWWKDSEQNGKNKKDLILFYSENGIHAMLGNPEYNDMGIADCKLQNSPIMEIVLRGYSNKMSISDFEEWLYTLRPFWDKECKNLYDRVRDLTIGKLLRVERKKDNAGNFLYSIQRKDERDDVEPEQKITLQRIPVFALHDETMDINFDIRMNFEQHDESVDISYELLNPLFQSTLQENQRTILTNRLAEQDIPHYWGSAQLYKATDAWKYKENGI